MGEDDRRDVNSKDLGGRPSAQQPLGHETLATADFKDVLRSRQGAQEIGNDSQESANQVTCDRIRAIVFVVDIAENRFSLIKGSTRSVVLTRFSVSWCRQSPVFFEDI